MNEKERETRRQGDRERARRGDRGRGGTEAVAPALPVSLSPPLPVSPSLCLPLFLFFLLSACSVPLYKVAPVPKNAPVESGQMATTNALEVTAAALLDDDKAFERFEANLLLAGILVVDVKLTNRANTATKSLTFTLQDATGKRFSQLDAKKKLKQMMKFEGVRLYAMAGRKQTLEQLQAISLPKKLVLAAQEERRGVLFFHAKQDVAQLKGLVLTIKGGAQPLTLPLN